MKNTMKNSLSLLLALCLLLTALTGCGTTADVAGSNAASSQTDSAASTVEDAPLDTFTFVCTEPNTLNMLEAQSNLDAFVFYLTSAMLYRSIGGEVQPELCQSCEASDDNCVFTYTIKDATYSDGTPIKAEDFVYYMIHSAWMSDQYAYILGGEDTYMNNLDTCEGIYATDEKTFVVELNEPTVAFNSQLEIYPLQKEFAEEKGESLGGTPADLQYSGPYVLDEWVVGSSMTFSKNDSYINAETMFPTRNVKMMVSTDVSSTYSMYANGEVDAVVSVSADLMEMIGTEDCEYYSAGNLYGLEFNTTGYTYTEGDGFVPRDAAASELLKNINFRKALCYAIDRDALLETVYNGSGQTTNRYVSAAAMGTGDKPYVEEFQMTDVAPTSGDVEAAKGFLDTALQELGYGDVSELPELTFLVFDSAQQKTYVETMISLWKTNLGLENITINLQPIQSAVMSMVYMDFDIYMQQLSIDAVETLVMMDYWKTTGSVSDPAGFQTSGAPAEMVSMHHNEAYDELLAEICVNFDDASRLADLCKLEQMLYDDYVYFPLMEGGGYTAAHSYVDGYISPYIDDGYNFANLVVNAH